MIKNFCRIAVFAVLFFVPKIAFGNVVINEIAWMGTIIDYNDEWIELYNDGEQPIDLSGWILEATDGAPKINLSGSVPAKSYFLLERTDDNSVSDVAADQIYTGAMGNSGENLQLKDASNNIVDAIDASSGWPAGDNATKQTMERTVSGWQTSLNPGGTPKAQNSTGAIAEPSDSIQSSTQSSEPKPGSATSNPPVAEAGNDIIAFVGQEIKFDGTKSTDPDNDELAYSWNMGDGKLIEKSEFPYAYFYPGTYLVTLMVYDGRYYATDTATIKIQAAQIAINEFLPNPSGKDEEEEWIEVYNDSDSITDISGWQIDDADNGSAPFTFPQNTLLAPKSYAVFSRQITGIALNNDKDSVRLLLPGGTVFEEIKYENPPQGKSSAKTAEGFVWSEPSPGRINVSLTANTESKNLVYQGGIKTETTKEPSADFTIVYAPQAQETGNGYAGAMQNPQTNSNQVASVKQAVSAHIPTNIVYVMIIVVLAGLLLGMLLIKIIRKRNEILKQ